MQRLEFALEFEKLATRKDGFAVIIMAAGSSSRMQGADKMFTTLGGIPVIARTLRAFENCDLIKEIAVVTRADKIPEIRVIAEKYAISKFVAAIEGGDCREASVRNGMLSYQGREEKVLIHDGARPFVSEDVIRSVALALKGCDSVTCAVKCKDTLKEIGEDGFVIRTPKRESLVSVQTPQGVNVNEFLKASSKKDLSAFTDDTSIMESAGFKTKIVEGDYNNIKITTPEDIMTGEAILNQIKER